MRGSLTFLAPYYVGLVGVVGAVGAVGVVGSVGVEVSVPIAALCVFFGLEVLNFDRFLSFFCCHIIFLSGWFVLCQEHRRAIDARLSRPVLESGHPDESLFLFCALAFDFLTLRRAHFFYSSVNSLLTLLVTSIRAKS